MKRDGTVIGGVSLILIFSVLCLAVFSLLILSSVNREKSLTDKLKTSVESYYSADNVAVEIASKLLIAVDNGGTPSEIDGIPLYTDGNGIYTFCCPINDRRSIAVKLQIVDREINIISWIETETENWVPEDQFKVWEGE